MDFLVVFSTMVTGRRAPANPIAVWRAGGERAAGGLGWPRSGPVTRKVTAVVWWRAGGCACPPPDVGESAEGPGGAPRRRRRRPDDRRAAPAVPVGPHPLPTLPTPVLDSCRQPRLSSLSRCTMADLLSTSRPPLRCCAAAGGPERGGAARYLSLSCDPASERLAVERRGIAWVLVPPLRTGTAGSNGRCPSAGLSAPLSGRLSQGGGAFF